MAPFVAAPAGVIALTHVRVIDGTGAAPQEDETLVIHHGRIAAVQPSSAPLPEGAHVIDLAGSSVLPGLVGMHDHLFYIVRPNLTAHGTFDAPLVVPEMVYSAPRLYLAAGVTTLRTTGSVEPYTDLNLKTQIDEGALPGPHLDVTGPYLEGKSDLFIQMHQLTGPDDARRMVDYWAGEGVTSFKGYMHITRDELAAATAEAHRLGLKITAHLCAVTYGEAAALGIDDPGARLLRRHGRRSLARSPASARLATGRQTVAKMTAGGEQARRLIAELVAHHVAITSTLPVFEVTPEGTPCIVGAHARSDVARERGRL